MVQVPSVKLSSGYDMPMIGLGTYAASMAPGQCKQGVEWGIDAGYRHIDTASHYGNEVEVGEGIKKKIKEGVVTREQLFVTTKLWNDSHAEADVVPALKASLARLKLDYVDLYLVHWPMSINAKGEDAEIDYIETWKGMEEAQQLGLAKSIGVSNFNEEQLQRLVKSANIKPVVNQIEINPTLTQHKLVDYCKSLSVLPVAYTPLGLLTDARPEHIGTQGTFIQTDPKLIEIAKKYNKSRAQIILRYVVQRGISVIPKSFTKSRIEENLRLFDFVLTQDEMATIDGYNLNYRCVLSKTNAWLKNYPY